MTRNELARHIAFVLRCVGAATLSFQLAQTLALTHPVWAAMSGIIVSQERLDETRRVMFGRFGGTVIGVAVAVAVGSLVAPFGWSVTAQMALAVGLAAMITRRFPLVRVCMWTAPIVFLTAADPASAAIWQAGAERGLEVIMGGLVGLALHGLADLTVRAVAPPPEIKASRPDQA